MDRYQVNSVIKTLSLLLALPLLLHCGSDDGSDDDPDVHTVSGGVGMLKGTIVLQLNGGERVSVSNDQGTAEFRFAQTLNTGDAFEVTVAAQPERQLCRVEESGNGVANADIDSVWIECYLAGRGLPAAIEIAAGYNHTCAIADAQVHCWGESVNGALDVPAGIVNPHHLTAHHNHTCVLDNSGAVCWGSQGSGEMEVPAELSNPREIKLGQYWACVIDDGGVKCWGRPPYADAIVAGIPDDLVNPSQLTTNAGSACVFDEGAYRCWGEDADLFEQIPNNLQAGSLALGNNYGCGTVDNELVCFDIFGMSSSTKVDELPSRSVLNPDEIAISPYANRLNGPHAVIDSVGVELWGGDADEFDHITLGLKQPGELAIGGLHLCAMDADGVLCVAKGHGFGYEHLIYPD